MLKYLFTMMLLLQSLVFSDEYCEALSAFEKGDFFKSKKIADSLAFKGDVKAQNILGLINLELGNNSAAQKWLENAGMKKYDKSAYNLAIFYYQLGNERKALQWMQKAQSLRQAKSALGFLYINKNITKAKEYFAQAGNEGSSFAKSHLCALLVHNQHASDNKYVGLCQGNIRNYLYLTGKFYTSTKKYGSIDKAIYYLKLAADDGDVKAMNLLGETLYKRRGPSDEVNALSYFKKAASFGNVRAKVNAAWIYYTGVRWTKKPKLGYEILQSAMEDGSVKAKFYMGVLYARGSTFSYARVPYNPAKGLELIKSAAAQNDPEAMQYLINNGLSEEELSSYQKQLKAYHRQIDKQASLGFLYDGCQ